jgi:hypothetical protein
MKALIVMFAAIVASAAVAQERPPTVSEKPLTPAEAKFRSLDGDNDRKLSRTEVAADEAAAGDFAAMDTDGDGFLSMAEYLAGLAEEES